MKAKIHTQYKDELPDGSIVSIVIWVLPEKTIERPQGYKYRLNYSTIDGTTWVRYDNETGKGDHRHIGAIEIAYEFLSIEKLVRDFMRDVRMMSEKQRREP